MRYVISDIHAEFEKLGRLLSVLDKDASEYIFLGDYLDKGRRARDVIDVLKELSERKKCIFLKGDHEYAWSEYLHGNERFLDFILNYGGISTLESYLNKGLSLEEARAILSDRRSLPGLFGGHMDFIDKMGFYYELDRGFLCVHAGLNPANFSLPLGSHNTEEMVFIREPFIRSRQLYTGRRVIFGHTAFKEPYVDRFKIGIDTGATYNISAKLTALDPDRLRLIDHTGNEYNADVDHYPDLFDLKKPA